MLDQSIHTTYIDSVIAEQIVGMVNGVEQSRYPVGYVVSRNDEFVTGGYVNNGQFDLPVGTLYPDSKYSLSVCILPVEYQEENDTVQTIEFRTALPARNFEVATYPTGTTCEIKINYDKSTSRGYQLTAIGVVFDNGQLISSVQSTTDILKFDNLRPGKEYKCSIILSDNEGNSSSDTSLEQIQPFYFSTYSVYMTIIKKSSCAIRFKPFIVNPDLPKKNLEVYVENKGNVIMNWELCPPDKEIICDGLEQNSEAMISCRVRNMEDAIYSVRVRTCSLNVRVNEYTNHLQSITATYQPLVDGVAHDIDPVTGYTYQIVPSLTEAINGVQHVKGRSIGDKEVRFDGLYRELAYEVVVGITDGTNQTTSDVEFVKTKLNAVHIYNSVGHEFLPYRVFIQHNGRFIPAKGYVFHNGRWVEMIQ